MIRYNKIKKVMPIAVLSTMFLLSPAATFAAEITKADYPTAKSELIGGMYFSGNNGGATQTSSYSQDQLKKDLADRMIPAMSHRPDLFGLSGAPQSEDVLRNQYRMKFKDATTKFEGYTNSGNINTDVTVNHYEDARQVELLSYRNATPVNQNFNTPERTLKTSESFTYSNQEGVKLGVGSDTKVKASIPFIGEAEETIKITSEFSYNRTSSNTSSQEETTIFKSQPVVCIPGHTTQFVGTVQNAVFSGSFTGTAAVNGDIEWTMRLPGTDHDTVVNTANFAEGPQYQFQDAKGRMLYNIFKYSGMKLPSYVHLDDINHRVLIDDVKSTYSGIGGHYSRVEVKVFPNSRSNENAVTMPYAEYIQKVQNGTLQKELEQHYKKA
ncbi:ETX/MTX2 family pore-forming toxin [Bacillus thuringiensis]|uniref:ETX/MTX2 family pore-forming toxin n=1 Tax=Bacillus thuringiensis TaxID=1428 RepID=UPI0015CF6701|nr:ETX/MTX2 family pore-forming toxin [Bacillus thuringiensis]